MGQQNVQIVRDMLDAWNRRDERLFAFMAPDIEWAPAGPAAVESAVYRGVEEVARAYADVWETWEQFAFEEAEVRDLGDSVLWLGRVHMKGTASKLSLDQEFANHIVIRDGMVVSIRAFLAWREAFEAVGLSE